jgi:hypothetical protein
VYKGLLEYRIGLLFSLEVLCADLIVSLIIYARLLT